jgi:hypothetical protein
VVVAVAQAVPVLRAIIVLAEPVVILALELVTVEQLVETKTMLAVEAEAEAVETVVVLLILEALNGAEEVGVAGVLAVL